MAHDVPKTALQMRSTLHGSGRLELAKAITSPSNPLTARVIVNRIWAQHFGSGLVATPSDFGLRATPPCRDRACDWSHPSTGRRATAAAAARMCTWASWRAAPRR